MRRFAQQAEARGVEVKARQDDEQRGDDQRGRLHHRPETHFRVELLLERLRCRRVKTGAAPAAPAAAIT